MREEEAEPNWFAQWENELPNPEELIPLSQSLITPLLALAFNLSTPNPRPPPPELDSPDLFAAGDEPARTLKRPRLVWTPQLHKRFVDAVAQLGIKNAVPKTIMQLMSVDGLTRENVASHLQKYRLYLKRSQVLCSSAAACPPISAADAAMEHLFSSNPISQSFLCRDGSGQGTYMQFLSPPLLQQSRHFYPLRQMDYGLLARGGAQPFGFQRMGVMMQPPMGTSLPNCYGADMDSCSGGGGGGGGRRVLTLFPTKTED